jgi:hypothetical protein
LKDVDLGCIFTVAGGVLAGSSSHIVGSPHSAAIYNGVAILLMHLIRLRRDLVAHCLPHVAFILSRMIEILRVVRPDLGARQRRSVTDALPSWIDPSAPLSGASAKVLARVVTNLVTKSVVRTGQSHQYAEVAGAQKVQAQSLAQPFSKHAPYVLVAYLRALLDPLSFMPADVRRELEPALFALCDIMGEYGRDAIMTAMLDDSGKVMMKLLWREYDKQRYVGKG